MYIPRPAKLLFTFDEGWNKFLEKYGDIMSEWTRLSVERMLACGTCDMGVRRYGCASPDCTHSRFFCQSCKSKACSSCGMKATGQWIAEQQHILPVTYVYVRSHLMLKNVACIHSTGDERNYYYLDKILIQDRKASDQYGLLLIQERYFPVY